MRSLYADRNVIRIGELNTLSSLTVEAQNPYRPTRNFTCDATVDEFYFFNLWDRQTETVATSFWSQGRYHPPRTEREGRYTSPRFGITRAEVRMLPKGAPLEPPVVSGPPHPPQPDPHRTKILVTPRVKLLGVSWTWFAEMNEPGASHEPVLVDYATAMGGNPSYLKPTLEISLEIDGAWLPPVRNEAFSAIRDPLGRSFEVADPAKLRWSGQFRWAAAIPVGAILLATPYIDDVTIYYDAGDTGLVTYALN